MRLQPNLHIFLRIAANIVRNTRRDTSAASIRKDDGTMTCLGVASFSFNVLSLFSNPISTGTGKTLTRGLDAAVAIKYLA